MKEDKANLEIEVSIKLAGQAGDAEELADAFKIFVVSYWARQIAREIPNPKQEGDKKISDQEVGC